MNNYTFNIETLILIFIVTQLVNEDILSLGVMEGTDIGYLNITYNVLLVEI